MEWAAFVSCVTQLCSYVKFGVPANFTASITLDVNCKRIKNVIIMWRNQGLRACACACEKTLSTGQDRAVGFFRIRTVSGQSGHSRALFLRKSPRTCSSMWCAVRDAWARLHELARMAKTQLLSYPRRNPRTPPQIYREIITWVCSAFNPARETNCVVMQSVVDFMLTYLKSD